MPVAPSAKDSYALEEEYLAAFAQVEFAFGDTFTVTPGLRYEATWTEGYAPVSGTRDSGTSHDLLPSIPFTWTITDAWKLSGGIGRTVNRPKMDQLSPYEEISGSKVTYGNPDLDPQRGNNIDLDLSYQTERLDLVFGVFHRNIKGVIEEVSTGTTDGSGRTIYTFENVGDGTTTGISLTQRLSLDHLANPFLAGLTFGANENWATSKLHVYATGATRPFKEQPEFWGDVFVEWTDPTDHFALALAAGYTGEIVSAGDSGDERRPEETVLDLKASYHFDNGAELYLLGENLLRTDRVKIKADGTREVEEGPSTLSIGLKATF